MQLHGGRSRSESLTAPVTAAAIAAHAPTDAAAAVGVSDGDGPSTLSGNRTLWAGTRLFLKDHGLVSSARRSPSPPPSAPPAALAHHAPDAAGVAVGPGLQWEVDSSGTLARFAGTRLNTVAPSSELTALPYDARAPWLPCYVVS